MKLAAHARSPRGFTLMELLCGMVLVLVLMLISFGLVRALKTQAAIGISTSQLHSLVAANAAYAMDHDGVFCPAISRDNLIRWNGGREATESKFEPERGYLAPYLSRQLITCPLLENDPEFLRDRGFEQGGGGYGYNAQYIGGRPGKPFAGAAIDELESLGNVVMFATTAFAVTGGIQEYPFTEPFYWVDQAGRVSGELQPSTHFRARGKALVAWADGSVTRESPGHDWGPNYYGGSNQQHRIGWFGPRDENGFWNPRSPACLPYRRRAAQ